MRTILAILFCAAALCAAEPGQRAPGFALMDSKGEVYDLYDYRGKPVIVEFMQTTCDHCARFAATLAKVRAKYGDRVAILSIANPPDSTGTVSAFIKGHQVTYPILFDMGQAAYSYVRKQTFDLPQVYLIDANGIIFNHYGYGPLTQDIFDGNGLLNEIERLFAAAAPKNPAPAIPPKKK